MCEWVELSWIALSRAELNGIESSWMAGRNKEERANSLWKWKKKPKKNLARESFSILFIFKFLFFSFSVLLSFYNMIFTIFHFHFPFELFKYDIIIYIYYFLCSFLLYWVHGWHIHKRHINSMYLNILIYVADAADHDYYYILYVYAYFVHSFTSY